MNWKGKDSLSDQLGECSWPDLAPRYATALREAVSYVLGQVEVVGVIATGTIVRGTPHGSSDLDVYVIHDAPFRRRVQRYFADGVPTEIFINPVAAIRSYFVEENEDGRPLTAHMLATGHVVLDRGPEVGRLRQEATEWLARPSFPDAEATIRARYSVATIFEDSVDVSGSDDETADLLRARAVTEMLEFWCRARTGRIPRQKDLIREVESLDPTLGALARRVFSDASRAERAAAAAQLADRTIAARGFFEWDSGPQSTE